MAPGGCKSKSTCSLQIGNEDGAFQWTAGRMHGLVGDLTSLTEERLLGQSRFCECAVVIFMASDSRLVSLV